MHMPPSSGYKYIVQGRCSVVHWPEFDMLRNENARAIGEWLLKCFIYRWGTLVKIVSDNGAPFVKAIGYLSKRYHINHIRISGYNSRASRLVERSHFDVRQALFKAANGDQSKWSSVAYSVFWADRVTVRRRMGCSPYFAVTGTHPLLPFDIASGLLAWLGLKAMALAWLFLALACQNSSQGQGPWPWLGLGLALAQAMACPYLII
jgi:hypothetical protein